MISKLHQVFRSPKAQLLTVVLYGLILQSLAYGVTDRFQHPFRSGEDTALYAAIGTKLVDPNLYARDVYIDIWARDFPKAFYLLIPDALEAFERVGATYVGFTIALAALVAVGIYLLARELTGQPLVGFVAVSIILLRQWATLLFKPGLVVLALDPLLFWLFIKWHRSPRMMILNLMLGLLLLGQPLLPLHLFILFSLIWLVLRKPTLDTLKELVRNTLLFLPFAAYLAYLYIAGPVDVGGGDETLKVVLRARSGTAHDLPDLKEAFFILADVALPLLIGSWGVYLQWKSGLKENERVAILMLCVAPLAISTGLWLLAQAVKPLTVLLPFYVFNGYLLPVVAIYGGMVCIHWFRQSRALGKVAAIVVLLAVTFFEVDVVQDLLRSSQVYQTLKSAYSQTFWSEERQAVSAVFTTKGARADEISDDWASFEELAAWTRERTPRNALFIIPPNRFELFRLYSQRAILVSGKDGSIGYLYPDVGARWWESYQAVAKAYEEGAVQLFTDLARAYDADYAVVERNKFQLELPVAYTNGRYTLYELP